MDTKQNNLVDSTTLHAVESLFSDGPHDPWGVGLAGRFADFFIYSDQIRYPVPVTGLDKYDLSLDNRLLSDLVSRDSALFDHAEYSAVEPRAVSDEIRAKAFDRFNSWAKRDPPPLKQWLAFHHTDAIAFRRRASYPIGTNYAFDLERFAQDQALAQLESKIGVPAKDLCYTFDSILKLPLFGELTGEQGCYLNHPIRDQFLLPGMNAESCSSPQYPVSFGETISALVPSLSREEYTVLLHTLRGVARDEYRLHEIAPGKVNRADLREIAIKSHLPPRLTRSLEAKGLVTGSITSMSTYASGPAAVGIAWTVSSGFWKGTLPRGATKLRWLRWALEWDIEKQGRPY